MQNNTQHHIIPDWLDSYPTLPTDPVKKLTHFQHLPSRTHLPFVTHTHTPLLAHIHLHLYLDLQLHHQVGKQYEINYTYCNCNCSIQIGGSNCNIDSSTSSSCCSFGMIHGQAKTNNRLSRPATLNHDQVQLPSTPPLSAHLRGSIGVASCLCAVSVSDSSSIGKPYVKVKPRTTSPTRT